LGQERAPSSLAVPNGGYNRWGGNRCDVSNCVIPCLLMCGQAWTADQLGNASHKITWTAFGHQSLGASVGTCLQ